MKRATQLLLAATLMGDSTGWSAAKAPAVKAGLKFGDKASLVLTPESMTGVLVLPSASGPANVMRVAPKTRGDVAVFARVAPSVVVVTADLGHGTGFLIGDGLVVTNHHVIALGMPFDPGLGASTTNIHLGGISDQGAMERLENPTTATFLKSDIGRDLALLKIVSGPSGRGLKLAAQGPRPAQPYHMIGHPGSGTLWTYRSCEISGIGKYQDIVNLLMPRLVLKGVARTVVEEALANHPAKRAVVVSSCLGSPGDSGGPLVDQNGDLLGVTFAIPMGGPFDKFVYHVHQSELSAFLADKPKGPTAFRPDVWWLGPRVDVVDALGEGRAQVLVAGEETPRQYLLALDGDTDLTLPPMALVAKRAFDAEAALHVYPNIGFDSFFDRDNDGTMDAIYSVRQAPRPSVVVHMRAQGSLARGCLNNLWNAGVACACVGSIADAVSLLRTEPGDLILGRSGGSRSAGFHQDRKGGSRGSTGFTRLALA